MKIEGRKIFDITPVVSSEIAVFPGDTQYENTFLMNWNQEHHLSLSKIQTTVHLGAHADAPSHYHREGESIEMRDVSLYMGLAQVMSVEKKLGSRIHPRDLKSSIQAPRVLFKTKSFPNPNRWNPDFMGLSIELIQLLKSKGVKLVGIDTPSVDLSDDKVLEVHNEIYRSDLAILEGIVLDDVPEGIYDLIALPLKLKGAEASPVRAILLGQ